MKYLIEKEKETAAAAAAAAAATVIRWRSHCRQPLVVATVTSTWLVRPLPAFCQWKCVCMQHPDMGFLSHL